MIYVCSKILHMSHNWCLHDCRYMIVFCMHTSWKDYPIQSHGPLKRCYDLRYISTCIYMITAMRNLLATPRAGPGSQCSSSRPTTAATTRVTATTHYEGVMSTCDHITVSAHAPRVGLGRVRNPALEWDDPASPRVKAARPMPAEEPD
jgi:hypothetical protein